MTSDAKEEKEKPLMDKRRIDAKKCRMVSDGKKEEEDAKMQRTIKTVAVIGGAIGGLMVLKWLLK